VTISYDDHIVIPNKWYNLMMFWSLWQCCTTVKYNSTIIIHCAQKKNTVLYSFVCDVAVFVDVYKRHTMLSKIMSYIHW